MAAVLDLKVTAVAGSADGQSNTSRVKITLTVTTNLGTFNETGDTSGSITLDGVQIADLAGKKVHKDTTSTLYSGTHTVQHSADGTKTVQVKARFDVNTSVRWISAEKALPLAAIPRTATLRFGAFTLGQTGTITVESAGSGYTHTVSYTLGGSSGMIAEKTADATLSWTPELSLARELPTAAQGTGTLTVESFYGGVSVGSRSADVTLHIPSDMAPEAELTAVELLSASVPEAWNAAVAGHTRLGYAVAASAPWGAEITGCSFTCAGVTAEGLTGETAAVSRAGTFTPRVTVRDSRGRTATVTGEPITVYPYQLPAITAASAFRCSEDGTAQDSGSHICVNAAASCAAVDGRNSVTLQLRSRTVGGEWSGVTALMPGQALILPGFAAHTTYELQLTAADTLGGEKTVYLTVPTQAVSLHLRPGGRGGAFGKYGEKDGALQIAWDVEALGDLALSGGLTVGGKTLADLLYPVGSIYMSVSSADPAALFGGTWQRIEDVFLLAAGSTYVPGSAGGAAEETLTAEQLPRLSGTVNFRPWGGGSPYAGASGIIANNGEISETANGFAAGTTADGYRQLKIAFGGGQAHNNLPPYLAVYVWQRTA